ncbi:arylamine N-acetyltransferase family protein [Jatrophihabitans sp.]|uniref:arylamine N-acetyltransferase family protein n=1 Tax=Jatrophihabitans sp. TaxID=1932789 RepID=UPI002CA7FD4C|nr:arylamine N-acetyltransferase [Jatrophihabitans sp.]
MPAISAEGVQKYLRRLDIPDPGRPSVAGLFALHRAHVERIPYEVIDIQLGRWTSVQPHHAVNRVLAGRGGYCVQLNTAFSVLLAALGYQVSRHASGVQASAAIPAVNADVAPHMALSVELDGTRWLVDVGLGDGLYEPLPARPGSYQQGPFSYRVSCSATEPTGLRLDLDPRASVTGIDVRPTAARQREFTRWHHYLVTSRESRLVRALTVMHRGADSIDALTGCLLRHVDGTGRTVRELETRAEWQDALGDIFGLRPGGAGPEQLDALWARVRAAHELWLARKAASRAS